ADAPFRPGLARTGFQPGADDHPPTELHRPAPAAPIVPARRASHLANPLRRPGCKGHGQRGYSRFTFGRLKEVVLSRNRISASAAVVAPAATAAFPSGGTQGRPGAKARRTRPPRWSGPLLQRGPGSPPSLRSASLPPEGVGRAQQTPM